MKNSTAIIIPCYKVSDHIKDVIKKVLKYSNNIIIIDDCSPESEKEIIIKSFKKNKKIKYLKNKKNIGVGGSVIRGYREAIKIKGIKHIFKIDGDDQMDVSFIPKIINLSKKEFDYVKGNRLRSYEFLLKMPILRILGNVVYSFISKLSTGYYNVGDFHNGFTCISLKTCKRILKLKISKRYFFEVDILFNLSLLEANIIEVNMPTIYKNEKSNLSYFQSIFVFPFLHLKNFLKRIYIQYFLKDFGFGSVSFILGFGSLLLSSKFLIENYLKNSALNVATPTGTIILGITFFLISIQFILIFFAIDYNFHKNRTRNH